MAHGQEEVNQELDRVLRIHVGQDYNPKPVLSCDKVDVAPCEVRLEVGWVRHRSVKPRLHVLEERPDNFPQEYLVGIRESFVGI
jgi:hypothetical protein